MTIYQSIKEKLAAAEAVIVCAGEAFAREEGVTPLVFDENSEEGFWGAVSQGIVAQNAHYTASEMMNQLKALLKDKPYFIVTNCTDNHFELAGFDAARLYEVDGSWKNMQCVRGCDDVLYASAGRLEAMSEAVVDGRISAKIVPYCPICGAPVRMNVASQVRQFIPNHDADAAFSSFAKSQVNAKLVVLELGMAQDNQNIRPALVNLVRFSPEATYVSVNAEHVLAPEEIADKFIGCKESCADALKALAQ